MAVAYLGYKVDSKQVLTAEKRLDGMAGAAGVAEKSSKGLIAASKGLAVALGGVAAAAATIRTVFNASQQYQTMSNALKGMGLSSEEAASSLRDVAEIARQTRAPLEATAKLFQRVSIAGKDLGASNEDVLSFTESIGFALGSAGIGANEASGALLQLSQAMAGGTVRAEEFNSILEGAFPIAQAAANGIDDAAGSVGKLRQMVIEGKVSSKEFFDAIIGQSDELRKSFENTTPTISQAFGVLRTNLVMAIGQFDAATGVSGKFASAILSAAENLHLLRGYFIAGGAAITAAYLPTIGSLVTALSVRLVGAIRLVTAAMIANPIGAIIAAITIPLGYFINKMLDASTTVEGFGNIVALAWQGVKDDFASLGDAIENWKLRAIVAVSDAALGMLRPMRDTLAGMVDAVNNGTSQIIADIKALAADIIATLAGLPAAGFDVMSNLGEQMLAGLKSTAQKAIKYAAGVAKAVAEALSFGSGGPIQNMPEGFGEGRQNIPLGITPQGDGSDIQEYLNNIQSGLSNSESEFQKIGYNLGGASLQGFKDAWGIASPSKEATAIGENIGESYSKGVGAKAVGALDSIISGIEAARDAAADQIVMNQKVADSYGGTAKSVGAAAGETAKLRDQVLGGGSVSGGSLSAAFDQSGESGVKAFEAISEQVKKTKDEAQRLSGVMSDVIDGFVKGDLSDIGGKIISRGQSALSSVLKSAFTTGGDGIGGVFSSLKGSISGVGAALSGIGGGGIGGAISGIGGALTAAMPLIGVGAALISGLRKKVTELDTGIKGTVTSIDASIQSFRKVETSRFWGLFKNTSTSIRDISGGPMATAISDMQNGIMQTAQTLGFGAEAFKGFSHSFSLSLKGLSEDEKARKIAEEIQSMGDAFAGMIPHVSSVNELIAAASQRYDLETRLLQAQGKESQLIARARDAELKATNALNHSLLRQVWATEDLAAAQAEAARIAEAAAEEEKARQAKLDEAIYSLGSTRFEAEMLVAARRRGEVSLNRASQGLAQTQDLVRLDSIEENGNENNKLIKRMVDVLEGWQVGGFTVTT